jgi:hypothetical protein
MRSSAITTSRDVPPVSSHRITPRNRIVKHRRTLSDDVLYSAEYGEDCNAGVPGRPVMAASFGAVVGYSSSGAASLFSSASAIA